MYFVLYAQCTPHTCTVNSGFEAYPSILLYAVSALGFKLIPVDSGKAQGMVTWLPKQRSSRPRPASEVIANVSAF